MLPRINHSVKHTLPLRNGYLWVLLRHNKDCSNQWRPQAFIICSLYKADETNDADSIIKLTFNNYKQFKQFKDALKSERAA